MLFVQFGSNYDFEVFSFFYHVHVNSQDGFISSHVTLVNECLK